MIFTVIDHGQATLPTLTAELGFGALLPPQLSYDLLDNSEGGHAGPKLSSHFRCNGSHIGLNVRGLRLAGRKGWSRDGKDDTPVEARGADIKGKARSLALIVSPRRRNPRSSGQPPCVGISTDGAHELGRAADRVCQR